MQNQTPIDISQKHLKMATKWHEIITRDKASEENWTQFTEWLEANPIHSNAYNYITELESFIEDNTNTLLEWEVEHQQNNMPRRSDWKNFFITEWPKALAMAAILLLIVSVSVFNGPSITPIHYETAKGETLVAQLADDSIIKINSSTTISVEYSTDNRLVKLNSGEAFFRVKPDETRPFYVDMGNHVVKVVGTSFNAKKRGSIMSLSVTEGLVNIHGKTISNSDESVIEIPPGTRYQYTPTAGGKLSKIPVEHIAT